MIRPEHPRCDTRVRGIRSLNDALHAALARARCRDRRLVRRAGLLRPGALPPGAADPGPGRDDRRPGDLHRRGHPGGPERLAVDGRAGGRDGLGPRGLRRARLVGRLPASRGDLAPRPLGRGRARQELRRAGRRGPRRAEGAAQAGAPAQHLRPGDRRPDRLAAAGRGDGRRRRALRVAVRRRPGAGQAARRLRDPGRRDQDSGAAEPAQRLLLLGLMGLLDEPARGRDHLHEQLAVRGADRQPARAARSSSGRSSASCCCWPASAPWPGTSPSSSAARTTTTSCRRRTRCWRCSPRPRCGRR